MNQLSIPSFALSSDNGSRNQPSSQVTEPTQIRTMKFYTHWTCFSAASHNLCSKRLVWSIIITRYIQFALFLGQAFWNQSIWKIQWRIKYKRRDATFSIKSVKACTIIWSGESLNYYHKQCLKTPLPKPSALVIATDRDKCFSSLIVPIHRRYLAKSDSKWTASRMQLLKIVLLVMSIS